MYPTVTDWIAAIATCVIGAGGIGAFVYAARTYGAQSRQLALAKTDSARMRTPVLRGELAGTGGRDFRMDVWLLTPEPLASLLVTIEEARGHDCPVGFTAGQDGVEQYPDQDSLPVGWRNDVLRHEARWAELLPGGAATWRIALREGGRQRSGRDGAGQVRLSGECMPTGGGPPWRVQIPVTQATSAERALKPPTQVRVVDP